MAKKTRAGFEEAVERVLAFKVSRRKIKKCKAKKNVEEEQKEENRFLNSRLEVEIGSLQRTRELDKTANSVVNCIVR